MEEDQGLNIGGLNLNDVDPGKLSLYNQLKIMRHQQVQAEQPQNLPSFDLDDPDLLSRIDQARAQLRALDEHTMPLSEGQELFKDASTNMSEINGLVTMVRNDLLTHEGNLNTFAEDLSLLMCNKQPVGYQGNLRQCLETLCNKLISEETKAEAIDKSVVEMAKRIDLMFFKFSTLFTNLAKRVEIYEQTIGDLNRIQHRSRTTATDFTLESVPQ
jgi:Fic family protein